MKPPIFSIIIPAHNEEEHIGEALMSIWRQTYDGPVEIIVVCDNCTDRTEQIVLQKRKEFKTPHISVISAKCGSAAKSRNLGALMATGKYLIFHDADCVMDEYLLNNAVCYFENYSKMDGVATRTTNVKPVNWISRAVATQRAARWENKISHSFQLNKDSGINVALMRRDVFKKLGTFNEKIFYFEDNDLSKRFFEKGYIAYFAPDVIQYHHDPISLKESVGQCKSIARGMKTRGNLTGGELLTLVSVPINILTGIPGFVVFLYYVKETRDVWGSFLFSVLWSIRSAAKLYYFIFC